ncbi:hypothetical protein LAC81_07705 [Ensifer adhaerens]|uniref:hypothetical protein n=1 Tax=Ensifer adhaerens TaxID=106592 RepID=UPI001CBB609F|nr:hypothetical protein [Ensifer adhaerens]MBZ7921665.1 hypothetical protein [Ensifer adhaerens]UAX94080.1 hypothetical protein LAC78_07700 [Ensifer adhaerens]UAY01714.1 hypothetical protein LAC80_07705 [Ensifer adhaerens]UAY09098.1 hypothetical protein LAC81_07705 [Ensifer adhaerens]
MANETVLVMAGIGVAPYSARGLEQTLQPISGAGQLRRTINGTLVDLSESQMRKFTSTISGSDQLSPALNGIWPGQAVTVDCIAELCYPTSGGSPDRPVVSGSPRVEGAMTYYRPQLSMMVTDWQLREDEYGRQVSWTLQLEEV